MSNLTQYQPVNVYIIEVPPRAVNSIVNHFRQYLPSDEDNIQHLRRVAKPEFLPTHLRRNRPVIADLNCSNRDPQAPPAIGISPSSPDRRTEVKSVSSETTLYLLVSPTSAFAVRDLVKILSSCYPFPDGAIPLEIQIIPVPRLPPASQEQASYWSEKYWPTVYKGNNPFGPHPSKVSRAESELQPGAGAWIALAEEAAQQVQSQSDGEPIGAVIIDRNGSKEGSAVIVAGDARWHGQRQENDDQIHGEGQIAAHAVMRAIAMVARKRRDQVDTLRAAQLSRTEENDFGSSQDNIFLDKPITPLEQDVYTNTVIDPKGYLCVGLDIYITHEPCVMCSMAMLHSRFDRVIFGQRMPLTGGLSAEHSKDGDTIREGHTQGEEAVNSHHEVFERPQYGLFWRPELNWKFLAWEWEDQDPEKLCKIEPTIHA